MGSVTAVDTAEWEVEEQNSAPVYLYVYLYDRSTLPASLLLGPSMCEMIQSSPPPEHIKNKIRGHERRQGKRMNDRESEVH